MPDCERLGYIVEHIHDGGMSAALLFFVMHVGEKLIFASIFKK